MWPVTYVALKTRVANLRFVEYYNLSVALETNLANLRFVEYYYLVVLHII